MWWNGALYSSLKMRSMLGLKLWLTTKASGISKKAFPQFLSGQTGKEHKEMEHVIIIILARLVDSRVLKAVHAILDFIYYMQYQSHTDIMLARMQDTLDMFHLHKDVFLELRPTEGFNIPKVHSMLHYLDSIWSLGNVNEYNTKSPEQHHIDYAKKAYSHKQWHGLYCSNEKVASTPRSCWSSLSLPQLSLGHINEHFPHQWHAGFATLNTF